MAKAQEITIGALNSSLHRFSSLYNAISINAPSLPSQDVEPELEAIAGDDENLWTPINNKLRPEYRSPNIANKIQRNSNSPKTNESENRFSELSTMDTTDEHVSVCQTASQ